MIVNIDIDKLYQHPENPRSDIGDLSELIESIRENGVMQNLTVVPMEDAEDEGYYVVIGNRRLEAARLAGLEELPCSIREMDHKTQIGTMLLENMMREDLTPVEEAHGIQMMLDLGDSIASISEKTGLSESTVRHRAKLNELDQEVLAEKCEMNITISDLIKLEQIKDPERRNRALEHIGTPNFDWHVKSEVEGEKTERAITKIVAYMEPNIEKIDREDEDWQEDKEFFKSMYVNGSADNVVINSTKEIDEYIESLKDGDKLFYELMGTSIYLYHLKEFKEEKTKSTEQVERERLNHERDEIYDRIIRRTNEFVVNLSETEAKKHSDEIAVRMVKSFIEAGYIFGIDERFRELIGIDDEDLDAAEMSMMNYVKTYPYKSMVGVMYVKCRPHHFPTDYLGYLSEHEHKKYEDMYKFLVSLGYALSDEETQIAYGEHELIMIPEDEDVDSDDEEVDEEE